MEQGKKMNKSIYICSHYSVIYVINLRTGFGAQINCVLNFIEFNVYTIIEEFILR